MALTYGVRMLLEQKIVEGAEVAGRLKMQFLLDFNLITLAGVGVASFNVLYMGFPLASAGLPIILGFVALGLFAAVDLALARERKIIRLGMAVDVPEKLKYPPKRLYPVTTKFFILSTTIAVLSTIILMLVVSGDIRWVAEQGYNMRPEDASASVMKEILFVVGVMLGFTVKLIFSYARNQRLLFENITAALERVSMGDLKAVAPVLSNDEFGFISGHMNIMIEKLQDRIRILEGLQVAREIQENLLPKHSPHILGMDIAGRCLYSDETGGDYYDFILQDAEGAEPEVGIVVGDASGHGIGAAMLMAGARALLRMRMDTDGCLAGVVEDVNRLLTKDTKATGRFITLFYLSIRLDGSSIRWVSAGHDPVLCYSIADADFTELKGDGIPLGIEESWEYNEHSMCCRKDGSIFILGTDGIWEARNPAGEMFGKQRLQDVVRENARRPAVDILEAALMTLELFRDGAKQDDDVTLIVVKT